MLLLKNVFSTEEDSLFLRTKRRVLFEQRGWYTQPMQHIETKKRDAIGYWRPVMAFNTGKKSPSMPWGKEGTASV